MQTGHRERLLKTLTLTFWEHVSSYRDNEMWDMTKNWTQVESKILNLLLSLTWIHDSYCMSNAKRCGKLKCLNKDARLQIDMDMDEDLTKTLEDQDLTFSPFMPCFPSGPGCPFPPCKAACSLLFCS